MPTIAELIPSPVESGACIARSNGGKLWITKDCGKHWGPIFAGNALKANYLTDGTLMIVQSDHKILLFRGEDTLDISPPGNYFYNHAKQMIEKNSGTDRNRKYYSLNSMPFKPERFAFYAVGGTAQRQWIVAGARYLYIYDHPVELPFSATLATALRRQPERKSRLVLFVHTTGRGWITTNIDALPQYETPSNDSCSLTVDDDRNLYINGNEVSTSLLHGIFCRAGLFQDASRYYAMSDWKGVQVGDIHSCRPKGLARSWDLDGHAINTRSRLFEIPGGFNILTPENRGGIEAYSIEQDDHPPLWRWLLQRLAFGPCFVFAWGLLVIWAYMLKRSGHSKNSAPPDRKI